MKKDRTAYALVGALFIVYVVLIILAFYNIENFSAVSSQNVCDMPTIVIDAGHGGGDGGAVANGIVEKDINLSISKKLACVFRTAGFNVIEARTTDEMINSEGETLRERKVSDMKNRLELFNSDADNIVISIHQNKFTQEKYSGAQVFYSPNNEESEKLAQSLRENITALIQSGNSRECKKADKNIYLLYNAVSPAVIVECGFISNFEEAKNLSSEEYRNKLAFAVFSGFLAYYNMR